jgi:phosphoribosylglycinamide formyltransferase 1
MVPPPPSIVILISGRGSNMRALIEHARLPGSAYSVARVFSDQASAAGLQTAEELGVAAQAIVCPKGTTRADYDALLAAAIDKHSPTLLVLAGFMRILSPGFVQRYSDRILNIHPSLLPKYAGLHTHQRALEARDAEHGATVHFVTEELDGGPPIIQARVAIAAGDTEASLAARVQIQEHLIYPLAVDWFCQGRLRCKAGQAWLDGRTLSNPIQYGDSATMQSSPARPS